MNIYGTGILDQDTEHVARTLKVSSFLSRVLLLGPTHTSKVIPVPISKPHIMLSVLKGMLNGIIEVELFLLNSPMLLLIAVTLFSLLYSIPLYDCTTIY